MIPVLAAWRRRLDRTTQIVALFGGQVLAAAMLFTVVAVCMSALGHPILGDTEIVEFAAGVAVMSFMPYCQMQYAPSPSKPPFASTSILSPEASQQHRNTPFL